MTSADDAAVCRYCLEGQGLVAGQVCACRGSAGLAHASCLVYLAASKWPRLEVWRTCKICGQDYVGAARLALAQALFAKVRWKGALFLRRREWATQNLVCALHEVGRHEEAARRAQRALESYARKSKGLCPRALRVATVLASSLREMGRYDEAVTLQRQTLEHQRRTLGKEHPDAIISANNLASSLSLLGNSKNNWKILKNGLATSNLQSWPFPDSKFHHFGSSPNKNKAIIGYQHFCR